MQDTTTDSTMTHGMAGHGGAAHSGPAMALVPLDAVTHRAIGSGDWSDPATWEGGVVPGEGAKVHIPEGIEVRVDGMLSPEIKTIRADGLLSFATDRNTELKVDTLVTTHTGELRIGTAEAPIDAGVTARVVFADDGVIDRDWDPALISRGALLHGKTVIYGAEKTGFTTLADGAVAGSTTITLASAPTGWRIGDELTIAGTDPGNPSGDEVRIITAIDGATITLDRALDTDHVAPRPDLDVHVANLTRNIAFTSENEGALNRGHVIVMHTNDVDARYVAFEGLGRTDKSVALNDWTLLSDSEESIRAENTEIMDLGGTNVRGRYSVHVHRGGAEGDPAHFEGTVVRDDPGWAYVNHSSNVDFIGNVSHNITGAAYNTEAGDEVGSFVGNIAIRTVNPEARLNPAEQRNALELENGDDLELQEVDDRVDRMDFGWQGDGFWFHGAGVTVDDNVVSGSTGHAYVYWTLGLVEKGLGENLVDVAQLPNGALIGPDGTMVRAKHVPVPSYDGNVAYNAPKGLQIHYLHTDDRDDLDVELAEDGLAQVPQAYEETLQSTFSNLNFWNIEYSGIDAPYATRLTFDTVSVLGTGAPQSYGIKLDHFANQNSLTLRNADIEGFETGLGAPRQGIGVVENVTIAAARDIVVALPDRDPRDLSFSDITFASLDGTSFEGADERENIVLDAMHDVEFGLDGELAFSDPDDDDGFDEDVGDEEGPGELDTEELDEEEPIDELDPNEFSFDDTFPFLFQPDRITYTDAAGETTGLFFAEQAPSYVPVPADSPFAAVMP
ncbi:MAG: G8 domain-containing protein, partial [Pseudomonadota bacterium]